MAEYPNSRRLPFIVRYRAAQMSSADVTGKNGVLGGQLIDDFGNVCG